MDVAAALERMKTLADTPKAGRDGELAARLLARVVWPAAEPDTVPLSDIPAASPPMTARRVAAIYDWVHVPRGTALEIIESYLNQAGAADTARNIAEATNISPAWVFRLLATSGRFEHSIGWPRRWQVKTDLRRVG